MKTDEYTQTDEVSVSIQKMKQSIKYAKKKHSTGEELQKLIAHAGEAIVALDTFTFTLSERQFTLTKHGAGYQLMVDQSGRMVPIIIGEFSSIFTKLLTMI